MSEQPWIRSYALLPRRLTDGGWVWLGHYEWQWRTQPGDAPRAVRKSIIVSRRARAASQNAPGGAGAFQLSEGRQG